MSYTILYMYSILPSNRHLTRYVKLRVAHVPGTPGTFLPPLRVSDHDMHHGACVTYVPWCMPGSLTSGFLWNRWRGKRSRHPRRRCKRPLYVSGKRIMTNVHTCTNVSSVLLVFLENGLILQDIFRNCSIRIHCVLVIGNNSCLGPCPHTNDGVVHRQTCFMPSKTPHKSWSCVYIFPNIQIATSSTTKFEAQQNYLIGHTVNLPYAVGRVSMKILTK